jgi:hypothetical protein
MLIAVEEKFDSSSRDLIAEHGFVFKYGTGIPHPF